MGLHEMTQRENQDKMEKEEITELHHENVNTSVLSLLRVLFDIPKK